VSTAQDTSSRSIWAKPGVGAAGRIVQRSDSVVHRISIDEPTLILVEEGRKTIRWASGEKAAIRGEALSIQAGQTVDIINELGPTGNYRARWISWNQDLIRERDSTDLRSDPVVQHTELCASFHSSFLQAFEALNDRVQLPTSVATNRLQEVLLWLSARGFKFRFSHPRPTTQQIRRLIASDPSAEWSMDRVAQLTAASVATLRRRLAAEGAGFRDLLQDVRMSHALTMLQSTDAPVLNIALAVGYDSASRFTARFRARFGCLPSDIRGHRRGARRRFA